MTRIKARPTKYFIFYFVLTVALIALLPLFKLNVVSSFLLLALLIFLLFDFILSRFVQAIKIELSTQQNMALNRWQVVELIIENNGKRSLVTDVSLHLHNLLELKPLAQSIVIDAAQKAKMKFSICPHRRGDAQINAVEFRITSPFKLWQTNWKIDKEISLKVYPDFSCITSKQGLNGVFNKSIEGLRFEKKRGDGIEFHQLREYRLGDSVRQIDWQATSKRRKLISREYQEEQNQHVVVMLDASNKMGIQTDSGSHFDHALNALLMLAYTVLKQGDSFSMQSFNQAIRWLPDIKGSQNVSQVMNHFYDLYPDQSGSDYLVAVEQLIKKRTKRSLVLLVTTVDEQNTDELFTAIEVLKKYHLVALLNITNRAVTEVLNEEVKIYDDATRYCAALSLLNSHKSMMAKFKKEGVIAIDCKAEQILPHVINTYLNIKHSGAL